MRHFPWLCCSLSASAFATLRFAPPTQADPQRHITAETAAETTETDDTAQALAADLRITPRISADYNSPQAGDASVGYSRLNAFIPVVQTPGQSLTFLNTAVRLDTQNRMGANVAIGHRFLENDLLWGGYLAYDIRNTTLGTFNQLGAGIEVYGENWDAHLNGYLPVGTSSLTTGSLVTGTSFQGSQLLLSTGSTSQAAQGGADVEAGLKLTDLGAWGNLWGYGGTYWYGNNFGARLRFEQRSLNAFNLGVGIDTGGLGTNIFASIGVGWGGAPQRPATDIAETAPLNHTALKQDGDTPPTNNTPNGSSDLGVLQAIWSRAANLPSRNSSVVIEQEIVPTGTEVAVNPATGQPYVIRHVNPNVGTPNQGDGSVENPFTTLGTSSGDAGTGLGSITSGEIIYVQAGDSRTNNLAAFTIPAGVQVYSDAVAQTLSTSQGQVTLPNSGTGVRPLVNGATGVGITLTGGNNLVSGFEVINSTSGISSTNSANSTIQNNVVTGSSLHGIFASNQAGITIRNNQVNTTSTQLVGMTDPAAAISLANVTSTVLIDNNTVTGTQVGANPANHLVEGIGIGFLNSSGTVDLTVSNNTVTGNAGEGIALGLTGTTTQGSFTIVNNTSQNNGSTTPIVFGDGIQVVAEGASQITQLFIEGNTVSGNRDDGIDVSANQGAAGTASIRNATIQNNATVNNNDSQGILLRTNNNGSMTITVQNNTINGNTTPPGLTAETSGASSLCLALTGNTSSNGFTLTEGAGTTFTAANLAGITAANTGTVTVGAGIADAGNACP